MHIYKGTLEGKPNTPGSTGHQCMIIQYKKFWSRSSQGYPKQLRLLLLLLVAQSN